jgi:addiction module HigA family antidote
MIADPSIGIPPHPGSFILEEILNKQGLTVSEAAQQLGIRRATLYDVIRGKTPVSPEMAFQVEKVFAVDKVDMETLLTMQVKYDVFRIRKQAGEVGPKVAPSLNKRDQGQAAEKLVVNGVLRAGIPASPTPTNHRGHDILAHLPGELPQRIQVKSREYRAATNFVGWRYDDDFDWLAIVLLNPPGYERRVFIAPRTVVDERSHDAKFRKGRSFTVKNVGRKLAEFEDNYSLSKAGTIQRLSRIPRRD